jgi:hypothetical protein
MYAFCPHLLSVSKLQGRDMVHDDYGTDENPATLYMIVYASAALA